MNRRFDEIRMRAKNALRHYPISFIFALLACVFQCYWLKTGTVKTIFGQQSLLLSALSILGFFISLSATLFADSQREPDNRKWKLFAGLFTAVALLACYIRLSELQKIGSSIYFSWQFLLLLAAAGLTVFFAGVVHRERNFRVHVIAMAVNILISYLYAFVVFLGISLLLAGADLLFGLLVFSDVLFYVASACFLPLMALFFLARVGDGTGEKHKGVLSLIDNVFGNILVPVLSAYVILLYLYIVKIVVLRELPTTSVVNLILWPLALGVLVLFVVDHDREHTAIYYFRRYMPPASLPLLALMYYAWFLRVSQYGMTESRYMVFAMGLWLTFAMIHFMVEKREMHMVLPMTLTLIFLVAVFGGPVGAESISFRSQKGRLDLLLIENHMLKGGKIVEPKQISKEDRMEIRNIVDYLRLNHDVSGIPYFQGASDDIIDNALGEAVDGEDLSLNFEEDRGFDIEGYDRMYMVESYSDGETEREGIRIRRQKGIIDILYPGSEEADLSVDLQDLREKIQILKREKENVVPEDLIITGENSLYRCKVSFYKTAFILNEGAIESGDGVGMLIMLEKK